MTIAEETHPDLFTCNCGGFMFAGCGIKGGMTLEEELNLKSQIPILGSIPIIRWLFRNETKTEAERELLIFITPEIIGG